MRELEIIGELRGFSPSPTAEELLDELECLLCSDVLWPLPVRTAAEEVFGGGIHNPKGRVFKSLDRRIRHCLRTWRSRYGLNPEQMIYAGEVMAWAIHRGAAEAKTQQARYPFVLKRLESLVNDERVHQRMTARAGLVDVTAELEEFHASAA